MGKHSRFNAGRLFKPTDDQRRQVLMMTGFGILQEDIAIALRIDKKTLYKHFRRELDTGRTEANVRVAQALYTNATKHMSVSAQIWWTKARMGWKEAQDLNVGGTTTPIAVEFTWADAALPTLLPKPEEADGGIDWAEAETISDC
jgi:hypothetical protein